MGRMISGVIDSVLSEDYKTRLPTVDEEPSYLLVLRQKQRNTLNGE